MNDAKYFYKGICVFGDVFHTPDFEAALGKIECVYTDFKVGVASLAFSVLILVAAVGGLFISCNWFLIGAVVLLLNIPVCIWLRGILYNYVDLRVKIDGHVYKIVTCGIRQRQKLYEIEDYFKNIIQEEMNQITANSCCNS